MEKLRADILATRALNASRKLHLPTYVATRYLLESVAGSKESSWIYEVVSRKYLIREQGRFYKISKFKKINANNELEYREFVVPGPTALLAECILLGFYSQTDSFRKNDRVYSYIWPSSIDCSYNFEHYISGYRKRNNDIASYLSINEEKILIVADIEKFYPSIDQNTVRERFVNNLQDSQLSDEIKDLSLKVFNDLCAFYPDGKGITTGPEFSHVIGDLALQKFDEVLSEKYNDAYFRYVDDIVLIIDPEGKEEAIELLEALAVDEMLKINPDKNDVLTSEAWLKYGPHNEHNVRHDSFEALLFKIKTYLQINPDNEDSLNSILNDTGFSIPLGRLSVASKSSVFVSRLIGFLSVGWKVALKATIASDKDILNEANIVRKKVYSDLLRYTETNIPEGSTLKKWHFQKFRYLTSRAVYLFPHKDLNFLVQKLDGIPEFIDTVALLKTLIDNDYSKLIDMPGAALQACAGLLKQKNRRLNDIKIYPDSTPSHIESAAIFALWDVANLSFTNMPIQNNKVLEYLKFASGVSGYERKIDGFSYIDEIKSLGIHKNKKDNLRVIESRFSDSEASVLDALDIGWNSEY